MKYMFLILVYTLTLNSFAEDLCLKKEKNGKLLRQILQKSKNCYESKYIPGSEECVYKAFKTVIKIVGSTFNNKDKESGLSGSGFYIESNDPDIDLRVLKNEDNKIHIRLSWKDITRSGCPSDEAAINIEGEVGHPNSLDDKLITLGGAAISVCTHGEKKCPLSEDHRSSRWGTFTSMEECQARVNDWKSYGVNTGDPQCVPCKKLTLNVFGMIDCVWK